MKLIIYTSIFLIVSNFAFADIKVNKCDNIKNHNQKINCLTKLRLQAVKENSKEKINIIEGKLSKSHENIGKGVKKLEKEISSVAKKVSKITKNIDKKAREITKNINKKRSKERSKEKKNYIKDFFKKQKDKF